MGEIKREAGDKTKGFTLQKQRALALFFDQVKINKDINVNVAIEHKGDVYLQNGDSSYVEEQKNYDPETAFSLNSRQIINSLAYFVNIWLSESKSANFKFGFYTTNNYTKESTSKLSTELNITFPSEPILELISTHNYTKQPIVIEIMKSYLVHEYQVKYSQNIESELTNVNLEKFLNSITWFFNQDNEKNYENEVLDKIKGSEFASNLNNPHQPFLVLGSLMYALEKKQDETDPILKFLRKDSVENIFLKISQGQDIPINAYKYIKYDYTEILKKTGEYLKKYLETKYYSNVQNKTFPEIIKRKVARHNTEVKILQQNLEQTDVEKAKELEVIIKEIGDLINSDKPTFLFGDIGSGKSTLLAHYFFNDLHSGLLPIFIPTTFLRGKAINDIVKLKTLINDFVNHELNISEKHFNLDVALLSKKEIVLVIDGVDELEKTDAKKLIDLLHSFSNSNLRVVASGRPIELKEIVNYNQWNCLTTLDLTEKEIIQILKNEAIAEGLNETLSLADANKRLKTLKSKQELYANCTTPLVVCLIRDFIDENINSKTLGDIMYDVIKKRLSWNENDGKNTYWHFTSAFPNPIQREIFISELAYTLYLSPNSKINEDQLYHIFDSQELIPESLKNRLNVINDAILFFKSNFLQNISNEYVFQSHQLFQFCLGLNVYSKIESNTEFKWKGSPINEWRVFSFAGAVARRKGKVQVFRSAFNDFLTKLLISKDYTPASAVFLSELRDIELNKEYLKKVKTLGFRPLMFWGNSDSLVPTAYALIIKDNNEEGFNWFFEHYLDTRHPSKLGMEDSGISILRAYIFEKDFKISTHEKDLISSVINFNLKAMTYSCNTLLPTISIVLPDAFDIKQRCILLAMLLEVNLMREKAEELLFVEYNKGNQNYVLEALEIVSKKDYIKVNCLKFWLKLPISNLPINITNLCIQAIGKGDDELFHLIKSRHGEDQLKSYLKYSCLIMNQCSDSSALILASYFNEKDIHLIGLPILIKANWFDFKSLDREKVFEELIFNNGEEGVQYVINNIPESNGDAGISEIFVKNFLKALLISSEIHLNPFLNVVMNLSKYSLARYPEVRENFINLLQRKEYYNVLKNTLEHLDVNLKYFSASVLAIYKPNEEKKAIEIIIRSAFRGFSDNHEWLRFCMKLNFGPEMLEYIYGLINDLPKCSRIFALKILYHNNEHRLDETLKKELISELVGDSRFLDYGNMNGQDDGLERITCNPRFINIIRESLNGSNIKLSISAASILINYHYESLSLNEKAKCWLLNVQQYEFSLVDFYNKNIELFESPEFVNALKAENLAMVELLSGRQFVLMKFYEVLKENGNFKDFFLALFSSDRSFDHSRLEYLYWFFIEIARNSSDQGLEFGKGIKALMEIPSFNENKNRNYLYPQLAVLAHEFKALSQDNLKEILENYQIPQNEIACALLSRYGNVPDNYCSDRSFHSTLTIFTQYTKNPDDVLDILAIQNILIDGKDVPNSFFAAMVTTLIKGYFTDEEIKLISGKSNLGFCFAMIVWYARGKMNEIEQQILKTNIDGISYFKIGQSQNLRSTLKKIKTILIQDPIIKEDYIKSIIESIEGSSKSDIIDIFKELFHLKYKFEPIILPKLFEAFLEYPYRLNLKLLYKINSYVAENTNLEGRKTFEIPLLQLLKSYNSSPEEKHHKELETMAWCISLVLLHTMDTITSDVENAFLLGLQAIFIQNGNIYSTSTDRVRFKTEDLLLCSDPLLLKIDNQRINQIITKGVSSNVPEIRAICKLFSAFIK